MHMNYNSSKYKGYLNSLLAVPIFILTILLTASCGNDNDLTPTNISDAPSNLVATAISRSEIELTWQDNSSDEDGFNIDRKEGPWGSFQRIARVGADITTYSDKGSNNLKPDTTYYYRVAYYRGSEVSEYSNTASETTLKKVLSLEKESGDAYFERDEPVEREDGIEEGKELSSEEECSQTEEIEEGNQTPCDGDKGEIVLNADSPWMNPVVLGSLLYEENSESGLKSVPGLTVAELEEIKRLATFVQDSFLLLPMATAGTKVDSKEEKTLEIDRKANEIIMNANQSIIQLLGSGHYREFIKWAEGVSKQKEEQYEEEQFQHNLPPPGEDHQ